MAVLKSPPPDKPDLESQAAPGLGVWGAMEQKRVAIDGFSEGAKIAPWGDRSGVRERTIRNAYDTEEGKNPQSSFASCRVLPIGVA
jgi:hypothetical protein